MKVSIKAYDKYQNKDIEIVLCSGIENDNFSADYTSSNDSGGRLYITILGGEDPIFDRWSDLENLTLITSNSK